MRKSISSFWKVATTWSSVVCGAVPPKATDERHWALIRSITTAFLESIVNQDAKATAWLEKALPEISEGIALSEHATPTTD